MSTQVRKELDPNLFAQIYLKVFTGTECPGGGTPCAFQIVGRTNYYVRAREIPLICVDQQALQSSYKVDWKDVDSFNAMSETERKKCLTRDYETKLFSVQPMDESDERMQEKDSSEDEDDDALCIQSGETMAFLETNRDQIFHMYSS